MKKFKSAKKCSLGASCKGTCIQRNKNCLADPTPKQRAKIQRAHRLLASVMDIKVWDFEKSKGKISAALKLLDEFKSRNDKKTTDLIASKIKITGDPAQVKIVLEHVKDFHQLVGRDTGIKSIEMAPERSYMNYSTGIVVIDNRKPPVQWRQALFHELGHALERSDKRIGEANKEFIKSKATGPIKTLNELYNSTKFQPDEKAYPGNFITPYVGKIYASGATEVLSIGLEHFSSPALLSKLYNTDPDHFKNTAKALTGY